MVEKRPFIGREREADSLRKELDRERPSLIILYGRRRVGKSTLLRHVARGRSTVYYQATEVVGSVNLDLLKKEIAREFTAAGRVLDGIEQWEALLMYVAERVRSRGAPLTLILDEFPYICETVPGLPSIVQKVYDGVVRESVPLNLILCGSRISFMEELLGERNPLRGRQTLEMDLRPLPFRDAADFFPDWAPAERLAAYGVFGGMPHYLQFCDPDRSLRENVIDVILGPGSPLSNEVESVLQAELSSPARYATILQAIASGCSTTGEMLGRAREISDARALSPYLEKLEALRLIRVTRSLDAPAKARNQRFFLADPFLAFWYRFRLPNSSPLGTGYARDVYRHAVRPHFDTYMGEILEWIGREYIERYGAETLGTPAREVGKIWGDDYDLDIAGTLLDGTVVFGECKWWNAKVGGDVLEDLERHAAKTTYGREAETAQLVLVARSGFTKRLESRTSAMPSVYLLSPGDLLE